MNRTIILSVFYRRNFTLLNSLKMEYPQYKADLCIIEDQLKKLQLVHPGAGIQDFYLIFRDYWDDIVHRNDAHLLEITLPEEYAIYSNKLELVKALWKKIDDKERLWKFMEDQLKLAREYRDVRQ